MYHADSERIMPALAGELHDGVQYEFIPDVVDIPEQITGRIEFSPPIEFNGIETIDFVDIVGSDIPAGHLKIQLNSGGSTQRSLRVKYDGDASYLPLVSAPVLYAITCARTGNPEEAYEIIQHTYNSRRAEWGFRNDCRDSLQFDAFVEVLNTLSGFSGGFDHVQFRSGIGYFAKRILDTVPAAIDSFDTLESRVRQWNATEHLKPVTLSEVLGEKLGRKYYRGGLSREREQLRQIGFDPSAYDPQWETVVPACWMAHIVLTEGIDAAKQFTEARPIPDGRDYNQLKKAAFSAEYGKRGPPWGAVVAHLNTDDFQSDASQYLRWTGEEYRGKAKITPLLLAGALEIAPADLPSKAQQEMELQKQLSIGHLWRRDGASEQAEAAFLKARNIAQAKSDGCYNLQPNKLVDAEASLTHAQAKQRGTDEAITRYKNGIARIREIENLYDVHPQQIEEEMSFLQDMLNELR